MSTTVSKQITVNGQIYIVLFPNVGKFIDIKVLETKISQGLSTQMVFGTGEQQSAFLYITTYAHFAVLCPEMMQDLKVKSIFDLSLEDYEELVQVYLKDIQPWIAEVKEKIKTKVSEDPDTRQ